MPTVVEKPKMSRPMWNSLKCHIVRERQRKKQEQEADAEVERQRREREDQQKEQEMTLEETREQVAQSEARLAQLKEDKHQLFLQLKKVLNEDESRKKIKESNNNGEVTFLHGYPAPGSISNPNIPHVSNSSGFLQTSGQNKSIFGSTREESGNATKHSRSPSPPHQPYLPYKTHALSYSSAGNITQPYGSGSVGAAVYYNQLASSSASITGQGSFQFPSNAVYAYPAQYAPGARNHFAIQSSNLSKDELVKHQSSFVALGSNQLPQRALLSNRNPSGSNSQGYLHPNQEHGSLGKPPAPNMFPDQERFYLPQNVSGSLVGSSNSPGGGLRTHPASLNGSSISASSHSVSSGVQQPTNGAKNGPNVNSSRPPSSNAYLQPVNVSHAQNPRLLPPGGNQPLVNPRYYGNPN